ncbi:MAG: ribosome recycling factor [Oscillospiraceae bacterium]|nr:ribosome recycling factor [Oscillospiraceae bacterium]
MNEQVKTAQDKMNKTINALVREFDTIRAGRANPAILDKVQVDYYGTPTQINAMASVTVQEGRTLVIQPWDKTVLKSIEKAIQASDIGINPTNDGTCLRLTFPQPTEERRKELVKQVKNDGEQAKVTIRNARRDSMDKIKAMKKANEITEDDVKDLEKELQKVTDKAIENVDAEVANKEKEIMTV